ncbi:MAG: hypothetical protein JWL61_5407 [Gemmatimonadetes bacterium]|nr:hypothetical protein [Gemmatimonadota bacterium]
MSTLSRLGQTAFLAVAVAGLASCSAVDFAGVPATQNWVLIDNQNNLGVITTTYMTIDKGGAMNQGGGPYKQFVTGTCSFTVPLSGNWNGNLVSITSTGGACGVGYILTMTGTANGAYGSAESMSGTYRISYSGAWSGADTGSWRATFSH